MKMNVCIFKNAILTFFVCFVLINEALTSFRLPR